jgi:hypothetical protein
MVSATRNFLFVTLLSLGLVGGLNAGFWKWHSSSTHKQPVKPFANDLVLGTQRPGDLSLYA